MKLNRLQLRTLTLAQPLAQDPNLARQDETTGMVTGLQISRAHGDVLYIGRFFAFGAALLLLTTAGHFVLALAAMLLVAAMAAPIPAGQRQGVLRSCPVPCE